MTKKRSNLGKIALATAVTAGIFAAGTYELMVRPVQNRKAVENYTETEVIKAPVNCTGYNSLARSLIQENDSLKNIPAWRVVNEIKELNPLLETQRIQPRQEIVVPNYSDSKYE